MSKSCTMHTDCFSILKQIQGLWKSVNVPSISFPVPWKLALLSSNRQFLEIKLVCWGQYKCREKNGWALIWIMNHPRKCSFIHMFRKKKIIYITDIFNFYISIPRTQKHKFYKILMFIAALLSTAKIWKQPKWPFTDEWILKNAAYIHNVTLLNCKGSNILVFIKIWIKLKGSCSTK